MKWNGSGLGWVVSAFGGGRGGGLWAVCMMCWTIATYYWDYIYSLVVLHLLCVWWVFAVCVWVVTVFMYVFVCVVCMIYHYKCIVFSVAGCFVLLQIVREIYKENRSICVLSGSYNWILYKTVVWGDCMAVWWVCLVEGAGGRWGRKLLLYRGGGWFLKKPKKTRIFVSSSCSSFSLYTLLLSFPSSYLSLYVYIYIYLIIVEGAYLLVALSFLQTENWWVWTCVDCLCTKRRFEFVGCFGFVLRLVRLSFRPLFRARCWGFSLVSSRELSFVFVTYVR